MPDDSVTMKQGNVRYPVKMLKAAEEAADWEGIGLSDYFRSALKARLRETEVRKSQHERRLKEAHSE